TPPQPRGTVLARGYGRALDKDGKPLDDAVRPEHYVEDRFPIPVAVQETLAKALAAAGAERFRIGDGLARRLVGPAYLAQGDLHHGLNKTADVASLPGGHAIDLACGVRYGIIGEPLAAAETSPDQPPAGPVPEEARRHLTQVFGPTFLVFREAVQKELGLT